MEKLVRNNFLIKKLKSRNFLSYTILLLSRKFFLIQNLNKDRKEITCFCIRNLGYVFPSLVEKINTLNYTTCEGIQRPCRKNHLGCLKFLYKPKIGTNLDSSDYSMSFYYSFTRGNIKCFKYLYNILGDRNPCKLDSPYELNGDFVQCIEFLHRHTSTPVNNLDNMIITKGYLKCFIYFYQNNLSKLGRDLFLRHFFNFGSLEHIKYLYENNYIKEPIICNALIHKGNIDCLEYIKNREGYIHISFFDIQREITHLLDGKILDGEIDSTNNDLDLALDHYFRVEIENDGRYSDTYYEYKRFSYYGFKYLYKHTNMFDDPRRKEIIWNKLIKYDLFDLFRYMVKHGYKLTEENLSMIYDFDRHYDFKHLGYKTEK